jgi:hypothetical protein
MTESAETYRLSAKTRQERATFVRCTAGNNLWADCAVSRYGDLARIYGHPEMLFAPNDAAKLGFALLDIARAGGWRGPEEDDGK